MLPSSHNQKKDDTQFKNNQQPQVPENQTAWTKELKKHSSRPLRGAEMGDRPLSGENCGKVPDRAGKGGAGRMGI